MDEADAIRRALEQAKSKRSPDGTWKLRPKVKDWRSVLPPGNKGDYCPTCEYPLQGLPPAFCRKCAEDRRANAELSKRYSVMIGGDKAWNHFHENKFVRTTYNAHALQRAKEFDWRKQSILFTGPRGTGKSHLAAIVKRPIILKGTQVVTVSMPDVIDELVDNMRAFKSGSEQIIRLINSPVLSIEDVGAGEKQTEAIVKLYFRVIDGRYKADRHGLIVTTNHSLEELESSWRRFDAPGRVVSRLKEMCRGNIVSLVGERDWRENP